VRHRNAALAEYHHATLEDVFPVNHVTTNGMVLMLTLMHNCPIAGT
jgi:hypothetical protein